MPRLLESRDMYETGRIATLINPSGLGATHPPVSLDTNVDDTFAIGAVDDPQELSLQTQAANVVWAGPAAGIAAIPTWRALVAADLPGGFSGFANPTATIGLAVVNGVLTTAMRSDAAPPLSQAITPTWTNLHTFNAGWLLTGGTGDMNGVDLILDADGDTYLHASADDVVEFVLATASGSLQININGADDFTFTANSFDVLASSYITMADDTWIGLGAAAGRLVFDSTPATHEIRITTANLDLNDNDLIVDSDGDTYIHAVADDAIGITMATAAGQLNITINGANDFVFTANTFTVASGSTIAMTHGTTIGQAAGPLLEFDDVNNYLEITGCNVGIKTTTPGAPLHVMESDAVTSAPVIVARFDHETSGTPAALFGTDIRLCGESTTTAGNSMASIVALWTDATHASRNGLLRFATFPVGAAVGYAGQWSGNDVAAAAQTVIPNGTGDVTAIMEVTYCVVTSGGATNSGSTSATPGGGAVNLYDVAGDTFQLTIAADGSVTVARSAGALTYDVLLWMKWI